MVYGITYFAVLTNNPDAINGHGEESHREAALHILEYGNYPSSHRLPIYPILIAILYKIFGIHNDIPLAFTVGFTSLTTIFLAYLIAEKLFNTRAGIWAAALLALELHLLHNSYSIDFPDAFFTFFLTFAIYITLHSFDRNVRLRTVLISAALLSLSALTKPIAYYLPFVVFIPLAIYLFQNVGLHRGMRLTIAYLGIVGLILGGWHYHNYTKTGFATFSPMKGFHFLFYTGAYILSEKEDIPFTQMQHKLITQYIQDPKIQALDPDNLDANNYFFSPARDQYLLKDAVQIIKDHPLIYLYVTIRGIAKTMFWGCRDVALNFYSAQERKEIIAAPESGKRFATLQLSLDRGFYFLIFIMNATRLYSILLWPMVLIGMIQQLLKRPIRLELIFLILTIGYLAFTAGAVGHIRYRLPYESISVVFASIFLTQISHKFIELKHKKQQHVESA